VRLLIEADDVPREFYANMQRELDEAGTEDDSLTLSTPGGGMAAGAQILAIEAEDGTWAFLSGNRHEEQARALTAAADVLCLEYPDNMRALSMAGSLRDLAVQHREKAGL
jgi:hypothetical protein